MIFAKAVMELKREGNDIFLESVYPCSTLGDNWSPENQELLSEITQGSDSVLYASREPYDRDKKQYQRRDGWIAHQLDSLIHVEVQGARNSGTPLMRRIADDSGIPVFRILLDIYGNVMETPDLPKLAEKSGGLPDLDNPEAGVCCWPVTPGGGGLSAIYFYQLCSRKSWLHIGSPKEKSAIGDMFALLAESSETLPAALPLHVFYRSTFAGKDWPPSALPFRDALDARLGLAEWRKGKIPAVFHSDFRRESSLGLDWIRAGLLEGRDFQKAPKCPKCGHFIVWGQKCPCGTGDLPFFNTLSINDPFPENHDAADLNGFLLESCGAVLAKISRLAAPVFENAKSWDDVHFGLARLGLCYELRENGGAVRSKWAKGVQLLITPSALGREFSFEKLNAKFRAGRR